MSMPALVGPIMGPLIGGFLTTYASWRWIFWINLPIGLAGIILATLFIDDVREEGRRRFDLRGALLAGTGLSSLLFGIDAAATQSVSEPIAFACVAGGLLLLFLYVAHTKRIEDPILDLGLLRIPTFRASVVGGSVFRLGHRRPAVPAAAALPGGVRLFALPLRIDHLRRGSRCARHADDLDAHPAAFRLPPGAGLERLDRRRLDRGLRAARAVDALRR